jgi:predicted amidohydrolase
MKEQKTVRVAAVQLGAGLDVEENLAACLRMLDEAATHKPDLVVLPEFCNHLSWYDDKAHCYRVSVALEGPFLAAVGERAKKHGFYVVVNCTVQREGETTTGTSVLFSPKGERLAASDKQVLMGHENDFLERAKENCAIVETPIGRLAMYACMDGVINETPRGLAIRGAQILCNSLNSFALDEASLHVPVRAPENRVFIVAANKVGPLLPEAMLEGASQATNIPVEFLYGAGESQIVAPDGTVLAKAPRAGEAVIYADIVPAQADDKRRPDGTDVFASRRPELYAPIGEEHASAQVATSSASAARVAVYQPELEGEAAIAEAAGAVIRAATAEGAALLVLPELFCVEGGRVNDPAEAAARGARAVTALAAAAARAEAAGHPIHVVTSVVEAHGGGFRHVGVLLGAGGVVLRQPQLHKVARHAAFTAPAGLGASVEIASLPWGKLGLIVGDDAIYPETFRLYALAGAEVIALPMHALEPWETRTGLIERSAENRVSIVAATRPSEAGASLILGLWEDFTILTPWKVRPFDGNISHPLVTRAPSGPGLTTAAVHPGSAANKIVSRRTDVLHGRPWALTGAITAPRP